MNTEFLDTILARTLPQWLRWGSCKNLHDCVSILIVIGISFSFAPTFQHILHHAIDFKLFLDLVIFTLGGSVVPNSILQHFWTQQYSPLSNNTLVTTYIHRMIISLPCLFKHMKNYEHVAMPCCCLPSRACGIRRLWWLQTGLGQNQGFPAW